MMSLPSVTAEGVPPQLRFAAQPSVSTGPPHRGRQGSSAPRRGSLLATAPKVTKGLLETKGFKTSCALWSAVVGGLCHTVTEI